MRLFASTIFLLLLTAPAYADTVIFAKTPTGRFVVDGYSEISADADNYVVYGFCDLPEGTYTVWFDDGVLPRSLPWHVVEDGGAIGFVMFNGRITINKRLSPSNCGIVRITNNE